MPQPTYRDAESYLARYQALLTKALHLLEVGFINRLETVSPEISKQIAATQSESSRHALAYGRFEEMLLQSYSLIPNVQRVVSKAYDGLGNPRSGQSLDIYSNTADNILASYLAARDRDLRPLVVAETDSFKAEAKGKFAETASRNFVKQCYERSFSEATLFTRIFAIEPQYSNAANSVFAVLKSHRSDLVNGTNIVPVATNLQAVQGAGNLRSICNILEWITNEYLVREYDEEETPFVQHCRELTARLLTEHLWTIHRRHVRGRDCDVDHEGTGGCRRSQDRAGGERRGPRRMHTRQSGKRWSCCSCLTSPCPRSVV